MAQNTDVSRLQFLGSGTELFLLFLVNTLLTIVTLGIYTFWAKTRVRRYLWSQTVFDGERLEYTGTGRELFMGFLRALGLVLLLAILMTAAYYWVSAYLMFAMVAVAYLLTPVLTGTILYMASRYRLTHTRYRGIRFGLTGKAREYGFQFFGYSMLVLLSAGIYRPYMEMNLARQQISNTWYGNQQMAFDGDGQDLIARYMLIYGTTIAGLVAVISVWLKGFSGMAIIATTVMAFLAVMAVSYWYQVHQMRYMVGRSRLGNLSFSLDASHWQMVVLASTNILLLVFTLGIAAPWVRARTLRFFFAHCTVSGDLNYAAILQAQQAQADSMGEGFAELGDLSAI